MNTDRWPFPVSPIQAVELHWRNRFPGPVALANGKDISSTTPDGVLKRLKTWIEKNDPGGQGDQGDDGQGVPVEVMVRGEKAIVLTPVERSVRQMASGMPFQVVQRFEVKLWWNGKEWDSLVPDFQTCVWEADKRVRRKKVKT